MTKTQDGFHRSGGTIVLCQFALEDLAVDANHEQVRNCVAKFDDDVDIGLFPEHTLTGFVSDSRIERVALSRESSHINDLRRLAEQNKTALVVGFVEVDNDVFYNSTAHIDSCGELTVYRKRHLWEGEQEVLTAGDELVTVETPLGTTGLLTCYDLNFVDDSAAFARKEVQALLVIGAWPSAYSENWRLLCRARALDGVRWVVGVNRTGEKDLPDAPNVSYGGRSLVVRPDGGIYQALDRQQRMMRTELDPSMLDSQRELIGVFRN